MGLSKRDTILDAFVALLMSRRFSDFTVTDVCAAAGISRSTFYVHFTDRHSLLIAAIRPMLRELVRGLLDPGHRAAARAVITHLWQQRRLSELWRDPRFRDRLEEELAAQLMDQGHDAPLFAAAGLVATLRAWAAGRITASCEEMQTILEDRLGALR